MGEGAKYVRMPIYNILLTELLDSEPYPGTLNLDIGTSFRELMSSCPPLQIKSVVTEGREFGGFHYWFAKLRTRKGVAEDVLVVRPHLTSHGESIIEVIAPENLRLKYGLRDGDQVELELICGV